MKRYWLFNFSNPHSPAGGMADFLEAFDSVEEAISYRFPNKDCWEVVDMETRNPVAIGGKYEQLRLQAWMGVSDDLDVVMYETDHLRIAPRS